MRAKIFFIFSSPFQLFRQFLFIPTVLGQLYNRAITLVNKLSETHPIFVFFNNTMPTFIRESAQ